MHFTKLSAERAAKTLAVVALAVTPLLVLSVAADPYQPVRSVVLAVALTVAVVMNPARPVSEPRVRVAIWAVGGYVAFLGLSAAVNGLPSAVWGVHGRYTGMVGVLLSVVAGVAGYLALDGSMRTLARALSVSILVQSLWMFAQVARGVPIVGSLGNAALAGEWLCVAVAVVAAAGLAERGPWRWLGVASVVCGVVAVGVSGSRAAWVGLLAVACVLALQARLHAKVPIMLIVLGLIVGASLGGPVISGKLAASDLTSGSAGSRLEIWRGTVAMVAAHPGLGVGPGRFLFEFPRTESIRHAALEGTEKRADVAHSRVLQAAADGGVVAALAFIIALVVAVSAAWSRARDGDAAALITLVGLVAFGVQGLFGISTVETDALGWLLGGVALARLQATSSMTAGKVARGWRFGLAAVGALIAMASLWYVLGDIRYARSQAAFDRADFSRASSELGLAIRMNPFVDTYRVALSDVAAYESALGSKDSAVSALRVLDAGITLEPDDYDLHAARARLLAVSSSQDVVATTDAFRRALELYPQGVLIRLNFLAFALKSGNPTVVHEAQSRLSENSGSPASAGEPK